MQIEVSASDIKSAKKADDRGRVTLGSEYAGKAVTVAVWKSKTSKSDQTAPEKVSVFAHGRGAVLGIRMSIHTIQRKRHFGSTEAEPRLCGNMVTWRPMLTTSTGGVIA